ncbi:hypothetical protein B0H13DRAFT_1867685 [Mycena leptocephala]|nr:hypothetical protein B0H13DRAFT_1867685 [Mycena leptocephala]
MSGAHPKFECSFLPGLSSSSLSLPPHPSPSTPSLAVHLAASIYFLVVPVAAHRLANESRPHYRAFATLQPAERCYATASAFLASGGLRNDGSNDAVAARAKQLKDRETERYLFEEVVAVAKDLARGSADREEYDFGTGAQGAEGMNRKAIESEVTAATSALEKRAEAAIERMEQWQVQMLDKFELSHRKMEQFMKSVNSNGPRQGESSSSPVVNRPMTLAEIICHYCPLQGHMVGNCEHRRKHIEEGLLKVIQGRDHLPDGTPLFVPRDGRSKKDFVESYLKKSSQNLVGTVAGVYNLSTDMEEALFSNGTNYDPRDDEILSRAVTEANLRRQIA